MSSLLDEVAGLIRHHAGGSDLATARAVLRHVAAVARLQGGTWTGQFLERAAAVEVVE